MSLLQSYEDTTVEEDIARSSQIESRVLQIEADLRSFQIQRDLLLAENRKLRSNIAVKQVRNAPMRSLIPELCNLIFAFYVEYNCSESCETVIDLSPSTDCNPLVLAHVCRRWRALVLGNPRLWADLHIRLNNSSRDVAWQIQFWFRHACAVPMKVAICPGIPSGQGWSCATFKDLNLLAMRELIPYLDRIESLNLHVHHAALSTLFPCNTTAVMPRLEHLYLRHHGYILNEHDIGMLFAQNLCSLRICDPSPLLNMLGRILPCLKVLCIDKAEFWEYPSRIPTLLSGCLQLEEVTIAFPRNIYLSGPDPVILPAVSRLKLEWRFPCNPIPMFSSIRAPQLRHLSLSHPNFLTMFSHETLRTLHDLIRCSPHLTTLTLIGCNLSSICEISSIFYNSRALRELSLLDCYGTNNLLSDLTPADWQRPSTWPCPNLQSIKLSGLRDNELRVLIDFVRRRMAPRNVNLSVQRREGPYLKELALDARLHDFTPQGRSLILRGLSIITPLVKITGPLEGVDLSS